MTRSMSLVFGPRIGAILLALVTLTGSAASSAAVFLSVTIAPPLLPVYEQPLIPGPGYIWTPGYWAWGPDGYYWVPGTWVVAPFVGALWTPGYWGWGDGLYLWHVGYWGPHVGFYGGINYGFGYAGIGYQGGYWERGSFRYNRSVNNVNVTNITNTYNTTVINQAPATHVGYNGGAGGVIARPAPQDQIAARERHTPLLPVQAHHELAASSNRALLASVNNGHPAVAATPRPERFAAGSAPVRSFSQQAAAQSGAAASRNSARAQAPVRAPSDMHTQRPPQALTQRPPQSQMRAPMPGYPPAQPRPQNTPSQQGQPQRNAREPRGAPDDRPGERQRS